MNNGQDPTRDRTTRRQRIFSSDDARLLARRALPRMIFDFIDGAAGTETAPRRNRAALDRIELQPRVLNNVSRRHLSRPFLNNVFNVPFGVAPMGMCRLAHPNADLLLAEAAVERNMPICVSSAASTSIERMAELAGRNAWFQLYTGSSGEPALDLVSRAARAGYHTLVLTVDVPQVARRARDLRNGFGLPLRIGPRQFADFALHPRWSVATLLAGIPRPVNFDDGQGNGFDRAGSRTAADWTFLGRLRDNWNGRLIVKGVTSPDDARRIRDVGADAIWVSNHGGRQLDSAPAAISVLPRIRTAVGPNLPLVFCSGARNGEDVLRALAMGADFVMLGRPLLFALAADGRNGLTDILDELTKQLSVAMAQLGVRELDEVGHENLVEPPSEFTAPGNAPEEYPRMPGKRMTS